LAIISGGQRGGVADAQAKGGTTPTGKETALAEQARLSFSTPGGRTTERSEVVRASGNEVFALRDRTGTGQCPVAVTGSAFMLFSR
jgi:hypothetical protein